MEAEITYIDTQFTFSGDYLESIWKIAWVVSQAKPQNHNFSWGALSRYGVGSPSEVVSGVYPVNADYRENLCALMKNRV